MTPIRNDSPPPPLDSCTTSFSVLIVDDTKTIRQVLETRCLAALERRGLIYSVQSACDGLEGLELTQKHRYDFFVVDKDMPYMGGCELCRKILDLNTKAKVVLYTAAEPEELAKESIPEEVEIIHKDLKLLRDSLEKEVEKVKEVKSSRKNSANGICD